MTRNVCGKTGTGGSGVAILDVYCFRAGSGVLARREAPGLDGIRVAGRIDGPAVGIEDGTGGEGVLGRDMPRIAGGVGDGCVVAAANLVCKLWTLRVMLSIFPFNRFFSFKALMCFRQNIPIGQ